MSASEVYLPQNLMEMEKENEEEFYSYADEFRNNFSNMMDSWYHNFYQSTLMQYPLNYAIIDNSTGKIETNTINHLEMLLDNTDLAEKLKKELTFYAVFQYNEEGVLTIPYFYGLEEEKVDLLQTLELNKNLFQEDLNNVKNWYYEQIKAPSNVTIIYASTGEDFYRDSWIQQDTQWMNTWSFRNGGFIDLYAMFIILIIVVGIFLPFKKSLQIGTGISTRIPLEVNLLGVLLLTSSFESVVQIAYETASGNQISGTNYSIIPAWVQQSLIIVINYIVWMLIFGICYLIVLSMRQVITLGPIRYYKEKILFVKLFRSLWRKTKSMFTSLSDIDLTDPTNKAIIKILSVNFVILFLLCSIWFIGIAILIPYTIILFFLLRKYSNDIKKKYMILLQATNKMAEGNLEVDIDENLGVFEPMKEELNKVQKGFRLAVEEEMKSQKMKTELITNVSHDLKTPLTAIITYVNLLKEENVTEEERRMYINTLDNKSQRLKRLIEDLFEISKASSNTVNLNLVEIDLVSLIKQVILELNDKLSESKVELRTNYPDEKIILRLDSEKTYRIFENLIVNIIKYAMPYSRAYIDILTNSETVTITVKNTSAAELDFKADEISERFVRGDKARNTDGSGLGLAIVKSFAELQGGKFHIVLDGDLFKVLLEFPKIGR
jgi:signal transduction histidine kinase